MRKLNKLFGWFQKNPRKLVYRRFSKRVGGSLPTEADTCSTNLRVVSDAAYEKKVEDGYSLRGALYCRGAGRQANSFAGSESIVHVLDWTCKRQRHVTRSTLSAELLAAGDAADQGIVISHMLYELEHGPISALEARNRRM